MIAMLLVGCLTRPVEWLPTPEPPPGSGSMSLLPGAASSLLVAWQVEADMVPPAGPDTGAVDTGDTGGDTAPQDGGAVDSGADGGSDTADTSDPGPDLTACEAPGYVTAATATTYAGGGGALVSLGSLGGYGYLCDWSCAGDPWWVVLSVTTDGRCETDAGALPLDVGAAGSLELCARVYSSGVDGGSSTTCTATYTGGSSEIEVSG